MIRLAQEKDLEAIAGIEAEAFTTPWTLANFKEALANPATVIFVDEENCDIAGYLVLYITIDEGEVTNVAVAPQFRGNGIGNRLIEAAKNEILSRQGNRIVLEVRVSNAPAIALYEGRGFINLGIRKGFYEEPKEDAMIMAWEKE